MARHAFRSLTLIGALAACAALPDLANAGPLDAQDVFAHAAVQPKLILLALIAASPGAVLATAIKVAQRSKLEGGSGSSRLWGSAVRSPASSAAPMAGRRSPWA